MASRSFYSIETRAFKRGYNIADVDGKMPGIGEDGRRMDAEAEEKEGEECESWVDVPEELRTVFDTAEVVRRWREAVPVRCPSPSRFPLTPLPPLPPPPPGIPR